MPGEFEDIFGGPDASLGPAIVRTGVVLADPPATGAKVSVQVDADGPLLPPMPYLGSYVPKPGDLVWVLFSTSPGGSLSGLVLGGKAGRAGNRVMNGNFQQAPQLVLPTANNPPYLWSRYVASGSAANVAQIAHGIYQRLMGAIDAPDGVTGDTRMVHAGFPVTPGETLTFTAFGEVTNDASHTFNIDMRVAWMADDTKAYPNFVSETTIASAGPYTNTTAKYYLTGSALVPAGVTTARVVIRASHTAGLGTSNGTVYVAEVVAS